MNALCLIRFVGSRKFPRLMRQTEPRYEQFKSRFFRDASEVRQPRRKSFLAQILPLSEWLIESPVKSGCDITT